jgi:dTDP-4-dehydrorhamnose reductase
MQGYCHRRRKTTMSHDTSLVIGASGLVGHCLMRTLKRQQKTLIGTYASHPSDGLRSLDITDPTQVRECLGEISPKTIYLTAALTHVDYCENHPEDAARRNLDGPREVAREADRRGAKLVFYSTEYVFDGKNGPYDEEAKTAPLNVYGRIKLAAEQAIGEICTDYLIIRTTVVYGWERQSANFAMQIYQRVKAGAEMTIPDDQIGNPTLAEYLAETTVSLVDRGVTGIVNVVGRDLIPRSDFARALVRLYGGDVRRVIPVSTASLKQKATRPLRGGLRTEKLEKLLGTRALSLEESLQRLRNQWQADPI